MIALNDDSYTQIDFKMEGLDDDTLAILFKALIENISVNTGKILLTSN